MGDAKFNLMAMINGENSRKIKSLTKKVYPNRDIQESDYRYFWKWMNEQSFPWDLIEFALKYCVYIMKANTFAYIDKVLISWKEQGIKTEAEALKSVINYAHEHADGAKSDSSAYKKAAPARPNTPARTEPLAPVDTGKPEPIRLGHILVYDRRDIKMTVEEDDGSLTLYVDGVFVPLKVPDTTADEVYSIVTGNSISPADTEAPPTAAEHQPVGTGSESATPEIPSVSDDTAFADKVYGGYSRLVDAPWKATALTGSEKQVTWATSIRKKSWECLMSLYREIINEYESGTPMKDCSVKGIKASALIAKASDMSRYYTETKDAAEIINARADLEPEGIYESCIKLSKGLQI